MLYDVCKRSSINIWKGKQEVPVWLVGPTNFDYKVTWLVHAVSRSQDDVLGQNRSPTEPNVVLIDQ